MAALSALLLLSFQAVNLTPEHHFSDWRALPDCAAEAADEIVVCARSKPEERYRLRAFSGPDEAALPEARATIPGLGSVQAHGSQGRLGDAQAKVTLTIPF